MKILKCPVCNKKGFGIFEKMGIDFLKTIHCKNCSSELQHYDHIRHLSFFFEEILDFGIFALLFLLCIVDPAKRMFLPYFSILIVVLVIIGLISLLKRFRFLNTFVNITFLFIILPLSLVFWFESSEKSLSHYLIIAAISYTSIRLITFFLPLKKKEKIETPKGE